jgi:hypothetical protein
MYLTNVLRNVQALDRIQGLNSLDDHACTLVSLVSAPLLCVSWIQQVSYVYKRMQAGVRSYTGPGGRPFPDIQSVRMLVCEVYNRLPS